jgi:hypothetical protein
MKINLALLSLSALLFLSAMSVRAQGVSQVVAGPNGSQFRVVATLLPQTPEDTWKMQSLVLDTEQVKRGTQPSWFVLTLTTTSRNLDTDEKKQKFLLVRWTPNGGIESQCTQGWTKSTGPEIDKIMEASRALYQLVPAGAQQTAQLQLPKDIEQKITAVLNNLETSKMPCIQDGGSDKP